jgi:hypothetical protein
MEDNRNLLLVPPQLQWQPQECLAPRQRGWAAKCLRMRAGGARAPRQRPPLRTCRDLELSYVCCIAEPRNIGAARHIIRQARSRPARAASSFCPVTPKRRGWLFLTVLRRSLVESGPQEAAALHYTVASLTAPRIAPAASATPAGQLLTRSATGGPGPGQGHPKACGMFVPDPIAVPDTMAPLAPGHCPLAQEAALQ